MRRGWEGLGEEKHNGNAFCEKQMKEKKKYHRVCFNLER